MTPAAAPALSVEGAVAVWTGARELRDVDVRVDDGLVDLVDRDTTAADRDASRDVLDARGCVVVPGLVNAHHHLLQSAFRTLPGTRHVPMAAWLDRMRAAYEAVVVDPELVAAAAAVGLAESVLNGVTTVADHHLTWPPGADGVAVAGAVDAAARAVGCRVVFVRGSAGDRADQAAASADAIARRFGERSADGMWQLAVGPAGVHSDGRATFDAMAEVARAHGLRRRTQANEQVDVEVAAARYGRRPLELLADWGWLAPDVTLAHLCDITRDERAMLAHHGVSATHAPGCDLPMGWGVAPVGALLDVGVVVGLGTSGGGSNDAGHLLADARLAMQVAPLAGSALTARDVLSMATAGSAFGLGRPELGSLECGAAGDLLCYDVTSPHDAGVADTVGGLVWANPGRRPRHVVIAGRVVVRDHRLVSVDAAETAASLTALLARRRVAAAAS
jgi:8-oxoguanine deaminase